MAKKKESKVYAAKVHQAVENRHKLAKKRKGRPRRSEKEKKEITDTYIKKQEDDYKNSQRGAPSKFSHDLGLEICYRMASLPFPKNSLTNICKAEDMPCRTTVYLWRLAAEKENATQDQKDFLNRYEMADKIRVSNMFDEILHVAYDGSGDSTTLPDGRVVRNSEFTARSRLICDMLKFALGKLNPCKYGDKLSLEHSGDMPQNNTVIAEMITVRHETKKVLDELRAQVIEDGS